MLYKCTTLCGSDAVHLLWFFIKPKPCNVFHRSGLFLFFRVMESLTKVCSKCKTAKNFSEFHKNKTTKDGVVAECKLCVKKRSMIYWEENSEKLKEKTKKWREQNFEKNKETNMAWRVKNTEKISQYDAEYAKKNPEKIKEKGRKYYKENSKKIIIRSKRWYKENPEKFRESQSRRTKGLTDGYIRNQLKHRGYPQELVNNSEIVEVKRLIIKTKRLCKTSQN